LKKKLKVAARKDGSRYHLREKKKVEYRDIYFIISYCSQQNTKGSFMVGTLEKSNRPKTIIELTKRDSWQNKLLS